MDNTSQKTSKQQMQWMLCQFCHVAACLWRHLKRFSFVYGFLGGVVCTVSFLAAVAWYGILAYPLPWKVINPEKPSFEITEFRFSDYSSSLELTIALRAMFPVGTEKSVVDSILVERAGARIEKFKRRPASPIPPEDTLYYYEYNNIRSNIYMALIPAPGANFAWKVSAIYDENGKLKRILAI